jgi:hypothetical protein
VTARDLTDTHVRGVCKAAAVTFGLAYELWAKIALESGYADDKADERPASVTKITPTDGVWDAQGEESQAFLLGIATAVFDLMPDAAAALAHIESQQLDADEKTALWTRFDSKTRSALKKAHTAQQKEAA